MRKFSGFSLMEMMVVLLIVAIVMAASAPMISKRMIRTAENSSPWLYAGMSGNNIFYNGTGDENSTAMIGTTTVSPDSHPRLVIDAGSDTDIPALSIYRGSDNHIANLIARTTTVGFAKLTDDSASIHDNSVYLGTNQKINSTSPDATNNGCSVAIGDSVTVDDCSVAIGNGVKAGNNSIAIGYNANNEEETLSSDSITIGNKAKVADSGMGSIAIGTSANAQNQYSTAIGYGAQATGDNSVAIGYGAQATAENSIAIGTGVESIENNFIQIGRSGWNTAANPAGYGSIGPDTVYIPGKLIVNDLYICSINEGTLKYMHPTGRISSPNSGGNYYLEFNPPFANSNPSESSDRRLKNVGEMFTGGLEQVKKLEVYNYTFKKDSANTPRVGVMAQDLQKIFPNAVTKGEDGYLRIRMEDMFYAVVNAVKELDNKITALIEQVKTIADDMNILKNKNAEYEKTITELAEQNKVLMKKNAEFEERLAKLEGKAIKKETKEMTKAVKQESKLSKQEEKARLKAQKQAEKEVKKGVKKG